MALAHERTPRRGRQFLVVLLGASFGPPALVVLLGASFGPPALVVLLGASFGPPALVVLLGASFGPPALVVLLGHSGTIMPGVTRSAVSSNCDASSGCIVS